MSVNKSLSRLSFPERLNFLLTNRLPRRALTQFMGRFSKIENPLVSKASIATWKLFVDDLRLHEAAKDDFRSLHDCFVRELKPGARPIDDDPDGLVSPCDAVIGEHGDIDGLEVIQAKGFPYEIGELLGSSAWADRYRDGRFVTLRLKSSMYHRFHSPGDGSVNEICYTSGDTWNVNPVALKVVDKLFCRNERVALEMQLARFDEQISLVAVAAILVASVRIHGLDQPLNLQYRGANVLAFDRKYSKGQEIGYFEHGSTIILFVSKSFRFAPGVRMGQVIRMGQPLLRHEQRNPSVTQT
jgi:phosphatidylserine decarboxylase